MYYVSKSRSIGDFEHDHFAVNYGIKRVDLIAIGIVLADESTSYKSYDHGCKGRKYNKR